jgi:hypothetical protein
MIKRGDRVKLTARAAAAFNNNKRPSMFNWTARRGVVERITTNKAKRMGEYVYATALAWDERTRYGRDEMRRMQAEHERLVGPMNTPWAIPYESMPAHGWSPAILGEQRQQLSEDAGVWLPLLA